MSIRWVDTPRTLTHFDKPAATVADFDNELGLDSEHVQHVAELFNTPLTGAYNWDYTRPRTTASASCTNSANS